MIKNNKITKKTYGLEAHSKVFLVLAILSIVLFSVNFVNADLNDGLVSYYSADIEMNTTDSLYLHNLTNSGATFNNDGKIGESLYVNGKSTGAGSYVYTSELGNLSTQTLCMWTKEKVSTGNRFIFGRKTPDVHFYCEIDNNTKLSGGGGEGKSWGPTTYAYLSDSSWQFICIVGSPTNFTIYQNGSTWKTINDSASSVLIGNDNPSYSFGRYMGYTTNAFNGYIDEIGIWNRSLSDSEVNSLYNSGDGLTYPFPESNNFVAYLISPSNLYTISTEDYNFTSTLNITGTDYDYEWKNITYNIWFANGTLFNSTLVTGLSENSTSISQEINGLILGNYIWNVYACYSNAAYSNCSSATNNYSFSVGMLSVINATYNSSTFPTARETFLLQGIKNIIIPSINASLVYNGTSYPSTVIISGQNVNITNSIDIPSSSFGNVSFYWEITSFGTLGSTTQFLGNYTQAVSNFTIYSCSGASPSGLTLNFTLYDESSKAKINGSLESTFNYFAFGGSGASTQTYNFQSINKSKSNWMFCINSSGYNVSFSGTASYYADYYDRREYIFSNATVGNFTQNIPLYLSLIADTDVVTVTVQDQNYNPISGALVYIQEWNVGTNTYSTIGMFYTDSNGNGIINLELYNKWYRAVVSVDGEIVKTTDVQKLADTTWFINVELATANPYELFDSISHGLTFDNETNITTFVWTDGSGYIQSGCLYIYNNTNTGYSLIHSECVSSVAGIINYLLPGDGDYQLVGTVYLTPDYNVSKVTDVLFVQIGVPELTRIISPFGKILTFLFVGVATFLGVSVGSPIWGSMLLIGSLFLTFKLGWIKLSSAILWGLLSVVIVIIFRQKRRVG